MKLEALRATLRAIPPDAELSFVLSAKELRELLDDIEDGARAAFEIGDAERSAAEVAALPQIRVRTATVRRWAREGRFPRRGPDSPHGIYQLPSGEWRFPARAVEEFLDAGRPEPQTTGSAHLARRKRKPDIRSWRETYAKAANE